MDQLLQSCKHFQKYPQNLIDPTASASRLKASYDRLQDSGDRLFDVHQAAVDVFDSGPLNHEDFQITSLNNLDELKVLIREKVFSSGQTDPRCRFIFIHAPHSRAALRLSSDMLKFFFTYHQVMPAFLDLIFPFGEQEYARSFYSNSFHEESRLHARHAGLSIPELARSGHDLRFCYNLRSVERSPSQQDAPWSVRQTAVYHSYDLETGQTLWVNVKDNKLMKNRILEATNLDAAFKTKLSKQPFSSTLAVHLLFCEWAVEDWRWYINYLEESSIQSMPQPELPIEAARYPPTYSSIPQTEVKPLLPEKLDFRDIQRIQYLEEKTSEASMMLKLNLEVLEEIRSFYCNATGHENFPIEVWSECEADILRFETCLDGLKRELRMQQSRTESLLRRLSDSKALVHGILQYRSMKSAEFFASKAQLSADSLGTMTECMQESAIETKQETSSMRILTLITLFFLPGTFLATFMSADIIRSKWGSEIEVLIVISLLIMELTFLAWYSYTKRKERKKEMGKRSIKLM